MRNQTWLLWISLVGRADWLNSPENETGISFTRRKNLAAALSVEAAELLEVFQWLTAEQSSASILSEKARGKVKEEIADVAIYLLRLCDILELDLESAIEEKLKINEQKYPVDLSRGNAIKYTDR